jgi:hypothetical protein
MGNPINLAQTPSNSVSYGHIFCIMCFNILFSQIHYYKIQIVMKHLFIPYALAVIAKEKGFKEDCFGVYINDTQELKLVYTSMVIPRTPHIDAPLYQQIVDWFRDKHCIFISIAAGIAGNMAEYVWGWSLQGVGI